MVQLAMQVNLFISGRKLKDLDAFSKSDPQCIVYEKINNSWSKIGVTEQIKNQLNPDFTTSLQVAYWFEKVQNYKFCMIDGDGTGEFEVIGEVEVTMGALMGAAKQTWTKDLMQGGQGNRGQIIVRTQAVQQSNECAKFNVRVTNANNVAGGCMGMCAERAHFICEIQKEVPGTNNFVTSVTLPGQFNTADVNMQEKTVTLGELCNADKDSRLKVVLKNPATNTIFNEAFTSVTQLVSGNT